MVGLGTASTYISRLLKSYTLPIRIQVIGILHMATRVSEISDDETRALLQAEETILSRHSVGFALPHGRGDFTLGGSGTLVTIDDERGILTAAHVVEALESHSIVGLILTVPGQAHHPELRLDHCGITTLTTTPKSEAGPDIAFVSLPIDMASALAAKLSFYNLTRRRQLMMEQPPATELGFWLLSGFAGEWTRDLDPEPGFTRLKAFRGMHGLGKVEETRERGRFDYVTYEALYNGRYEGPEEFGGFSGGGLWHLLGRPNEDGTIAITDRMLSGVAFFQSRKREKPEGIIREITCHGPQSIYGALIDEVRRQRPKG